MSDRGQSAIAIVIEEAAALGHDVDDMTADYVLFEHTGYPSFWNIPADGATPEECMRKQVRDYFATIGKAER